jgi:hypothetical protein
MRDVVIRDDTKLIGARLPGVYHPHPLLSDTDFGEWEEDLPLPRIVIATRNCIIHFSIPNFH